MSSSRPAVIPNKADWPVRTVGELTRMLRRGTAPIYVDQSDILAIGQRCVTDTDLDGTHARPHSDRAMSRVVAPEDDDVLINSTGTGTIGRSVIFRSDTIRYIIDSHVTIARPRDGELIGRWLNDTFRSPAGQRYLESRCYAGSTNQVELSATALASMPISVPEIGEQRRIAEILDTLDDQIFLAGQIISKLEVTGRGLLENLLSRGIDEAGRLREVGNFETRIGDSGSFPAKWELARLDQIAEVERGKFGHRPRNDPHYLTGPFPFIQTGDVAAAAGRVILNASQSLNHRGAAVSREFAMGTIATTIAANIADTAILGRPMYFPDSVVGVVVRAPHVTEYVEFIIRRAKPRLEARAPQSAQRNINLQDLRPLEVPLPDPGEQARICRAMRAHAETVEIERRALDKLVKQRVALLHDFLSGRVRVPQEPPS